MGLWKVRRLPDGRPTPGSWVVLFIWCWWPLVPALAVARLAPDLAASPLIWVLPIVNYLVMRAVIEQ